MCTKILRNYKILKKYEKILIAILLVRHIKQLKVVTIYKVIDKNSWINNLSINWECLNHTLNFWKKSYFCNKGSVVADPPLLGHIWYFYIKMLFNHRINSPINYDNLTVCRHGEFLLQILLTKLKRKLFLL